MNTQSITFEPFEAHHLEEATALSRAAGWPHRREDWAMIWSLSKGQVALEAGRVVGTAFMTPFGRTCATLNTIIVDEAMRGRGLGRRLTTTALEQAGDRECRLTATADGLPLYEKLGFVATHDVRQHQGTVGQVSAPPAVEWIGSENLPTLTALDRAAFGADRAALMNALAGEGRFAAITNEDGIAAFAAVRAFGRGEVVGPVVAEDRDQARALIAFILSGMQGRFVRIDIPEVAGLSPWLEELGLAHVGGPVAMLRGASNIPGSANARIFALASQALG
ncbi:GNAT family N-acetyltransferase [Mesorhizobium muleiense]|uniref:GNAT family N-acetyltransferase n=1 Tax=Mesorhizobium muleiense TaxID=1004279 RepID=UPI001F47F1BC|nr:GNAT family N-acetyltransferase [Mesorhizobium muleiense]MCF6116884.1 GNAT family N-acetyltransferase [Mesorhizobium muleiense]